MRRQLYCVVTLLVSTPVTGAWAAGDDQEDPGRESTALPLAVIDVVLQNHIDPPTRQEMILAGTKALYRADDRLPPNGLSRRVSELARPDEIAEYLDKVYAEFQELPDAGSVWMNGALGVVAGRPHLIDAESNKVQTPSPTRYNCNLPQIVMSVPASR